MSNALAITLDFESAVYVNDKTIAGVDGWTRSSTDGGVPENFRVFAEPGNRWMRVWSDGKNTLFRDRDIPINNGILDVQWRWRAADPRVKACFGISSSIDNARAASRALTCLYPDGKMVAMELLGEVVADGTWEPGVVYHMRMRLELATNQYSVYMARDSLRVGETRIAGPIKMTGLLTANFTRVVVRTESGFGTMDIDDIAWEAVALWKGTEPDSSASNAKNWSTGILPDSTTQILFSGAYNRGCNLDKAATIRSVTFEKGYGGRLNLGTFALSVSGRADFTGLKAYTVATGGVRLNSSKAQSLTGPEGASMPPILHDGTGLVRLDGRALFAKTFMQTAGSLDLNHNDMVLESHLIIQNGGPASVRNLDGRSISVGRSARMEGTAATPLALRAATQSWNISVTDTLAVRYAELERSSAGSARGVAIQSVDKGGNVNWTFTAAPIISSQPRDSSVLVGQSASFKVRAASGLPMTYQWMLGASPIANARDSVYVKPGATLADNLGAYSCVVANTAGSDTSAAAVLKVVFPIPAIEPAEQAFPDSLAVRMTSAVYGARINYSRNGSEFALLTGDLMLRDSTTLRAYAVLGSDSSAVATWIFPKSSLPQVEAPMVNPASIDFPDTLVVTMAPVTPGSMIYYTVDQSVPNEAKTRYAGPFVIRATTVVKAVAVKEGMLNSPIRTNTYVKVNVPLLEKPTANPPGGSFADSQQVQLFPPFSAPSAVVYYRLNGGNILEYKGPFMLRESTVVKAIAIQGSTVSDTATWIFSRRLEAPLVSPKGGKFADTLRVSLSSKVAGASVFYTLDGRTPDSTSRRYEAPFLLDSTVTLQAIATKTGLGSSEALTETFDLVPDSLFASKKSGDFPTGILITLSVTTSRATIYYTLDGSAPGPTNHATGFTYKDGIRLDTNAVLKAVAATGQGATLRLGRVITETYTFIKPGIRNLAPEQRLDIGSRYTLLNPFPGAPTVQVEVITADSLKGLKGFKDIVFGIGISLPAGTTAFPEVRFTSPAGEERSLYSLSAGGTVEFISSEDDVALPGIGTYFLGVDTLAPLITLSGESFVGDSTRVLFSIQDNVSSLLLGLQRSDKPDLDLKASPLSNPDVVTLTLKNKAAWSPLWVKLQVDDHRNQTRFPADQAVEYLLAQRNSAPLRSPAFFKIGTKPETPWDMISIPLEVEGRLTLGRLKEHNSIKGLSAMIHDPATEKSRVLGDDEALEAGQAVWMGNATSSISSLTLPPLQTVKRQGKETFRIRLRKGWNPVANPSLRTLIWPHSRNGFGYANSLVKGLHGYDPALPGAGYFHADSLKPWKGYFVLYKGQQDTLITLRTSPVPAASLAKRSAGMSGLTLLLGLDRLPVLRLGASATAEDGIGIEDEPQPPYNSDRGPKLWSARQKLRLGTDVLRWHPDAVMTWRVVAAAPASNTKDTSAGPPGARVEIADLPLGHAAYAVSRSRGVKFAVAEGGLIPLTPGVSDSLDIYAGPAPALAARLAGIPVAAESFRLSAAANPGGFRIGLSLPWQASIRWSLWSLDGRTLDRAEMTLAPGFYDLSRQGRSGPLPRGMYLLRLDWTGNGRSGLLTRKLALP